MNKKYFVYLYIFITLLTAGYYYYTQKQEQQVINGQLSWDIVFTGNVFTWTLLWSWDIDIITWENADPSEYEKYIHLLKEWAFKRNYNPPAQPSINWSMNYAQKSEVLNTYLKDNNFYFRSSQKLTEWYLYIKLYKPLSNGDIFLYFHDTNLNGYTVSGKLIKSKNILPNTTQEYLYKLNRIHIKRFYDSKEIIYNWLSNELNITSKLHFIWWYVTTSDWNYIKEISIVWK